MKTRTIGVTGLLLCLMIVLPAGCRHVVVAQNPAAAVDAEDPGNEIRQVVSSLRLNSRELDKIYDHLHQAAAVEAGRSTADIQLGYIQKTYLYVNWARTVSYYQVRLLSDFPYVKKERRADFLTLRARDLDRAVSEMEDSASFIEVYAVFIKDRRVQAETEKARKTIAGTIYLYEKLLDIIKPAVNPAAPFTLDPYSSFSRGT